MFNKIKASVARIFNEDNRFQTILIVLLGVLFLCVNALESTENKINKDKLVDSVVHVFTQDSCPHCHELIRFFNEENLIEKYEIVVHKLEFRENYDLLMKYIYNYSIPMSSVGTPAIFTSKKYLIGFDDSESGKQKLLSLLDDSLTDEKENIYKETLNVPFVGEVKLFDLSLPVLTILLGLADGFNPCAMWVLVYLLSITAMLHDKRKMWLLVGSFVLSSGILYYLFMTAWLNAFLLVGYVRILNLLIGLFALYFGIVAIHEYIKSNGNVSCKLEDNKTRNESMNKIKNIVTQKLSMFSIVSVVFLAFVVNSIEFVCSAALPATYTYLLTQSNLGLFSYYMYILLYTIMFMLDDIIVFGCAVFTLNKYIGTKYEKYSTVIGGSIMLIIGIFIVFFPNLLK
jgi:glutaredoxin